MRKRLLLGVLTLGAVVPFLSFGQMQLVWSDEFDGSTLNPSNWVHEIGTGQWGWGNNELQYYTDRSENIHLDSGYLHIVARQEAYEGSNYTSARIKTQGLQDFTYGRMEARLKVPTGQGLWPAFWMLGSNITTVGWPHCGEIDIMEHVNHELIVHGTIHYDMWGHTYEGGEAFADASIFHEYAIEWDTEEIRWYLDGDLFHTEEIDDGTVSREEFHRPFFFLLNLAVGGNWPGSPDANTNFPATMMVDYVRVYQGFADVKEAPKFTVEVYPNPAQDYLMVSPSEEISRFELVNLLGQTILTGENTAHIDLNGLEAGAYVLKLQSVQGQLLQEQIVIQ